MNENVIINKLNELSDKVDGKKEDRYFSLNELAKYVRCSSSTIYRNLAKGRLNGKKSSPNGKWIFAKKDVDRWLDNNG